MLTTLLVAVLGVAAVALTAGIVFVAGMRRGSPAIRRLVRGFARNVVNPRVLRTAGAPGAPHAVIHHVGRTTGRRYRTPVDAEVTEGGFAVALPYGADANWVRNVLAAGSGTLVRDGVSHRVDHPELVPLAAVADAFPAADLRALRRFGVDRCMRLGIGQSGPGTVGAVDRDAGFGLRERPPGHDPRCRGRSEWQGNR